MLLELAAGGPESCDAAQQLANRKIEELDSKITTLSAMRESLRRLVATYARSASAPCCSRSRKRRLNRCKESVR